MRELWSRCLIVAYGEVDDGAFPSLAIGSTPLIFEDLWSNAWRLDPSEAERKIAEILPEQNLFYRHFLKVKSTAAIPARRTKATSVSNSIRLRIHNPTQLSRDPFDPLGLLPRSQRVRNSSQLPADRPIPYRENYTELSIHSEAGHQNRSTVSASCSHAYGSPFYVDWLAKRIFRAKSRKTFSLTTQLSTDRYRFLGSSLRPMCARRRRDGKLRQTGISR